MKTCGQCKSEFEENELLSIDGHDVCGGCKPEFLRRMQEGTLDSPHFQFAGFWIRVLAYIVDVIALMAATLPLNFISEMLADSLFAKEDYGPRIAVSLFFWLVNFTIGLLYTAGFVTAKGATPGKMLVGIRIINADGTLKIKPWQGGWAYFRRNAQLHALQHWLFDGGF